MSAKFGRRPFPRSSVIPECRRNDRTTERTSAWSADAGPNADADDDDDDNTNTKKLTHRKL